MGTNLSWFENEADKGSLLTFDSSGRRYLSLRQRDRTPPTAQVTTIQLRAQWRG